MIKQETRKILQSCINFLTWTKFPFYPYGMQMFLWWFSVFVKMSNYFLKPSLEITKTKHLKLGVTHINAHTNVSEVMEPATQLIWYSHKTGQCQNDYLCWGQHLESKCEILPTMATNKLQIGANNSNKTVIKVNENRDCKHSRANSAKEGLRRL